MAQHIKADGTVRGTLGKKLDAHLTQLIDKGFSGVVPVAKKDKIVVAKGYGFANREQQIPVTTSTIFPIGSVTKQFTAAAILKLEMQGKLNVNDFITKYFKDVPPDKSKIMIHQLLTHSSGIPQRVGRCKAETTREDFIKMALSSRLDFEPGTKYNYSNSGYGLLGVIVEAASGESYEQYIDNNLFKPAAMKNTGTFVPKYSAENIALGYRDGKKWGFIYEKLWDYTEFPVKKHTGFEICGLAGGGMLSTIENMYKWHKILEGERVLSRAAKQKMFTPYIAEGEGATSFYGYGRAIFTTSRKTKMIGHNGNVNDVFEADFRRYIDEEVVYIIMTNSLSLEQSAIKVSPQIAQIIFADSKMSSRN